MTSPSHSFRANRILGCLLGGALGDGIGSGFEGRNSGAQFDLPRFLSFTDDTQLTIATCEAVLDANGDVHPAAIAASFVRWYRSRRLTGVGSSTLKALVELEAGGHWADVGAVGERSAGNGAAMRIAPLAFFLDPDDDDERRTIRDVARLTHRNEEAYVGALAIVRAVRHVFSGGALDHSLITYLVAKLPDSCVRDRLQTARDNFWSPSELVRRFHATGYVADSVPLAILLATQHVDIISLMREVVSWGGDTDTIGSMAGQILGAMMGEAIVPECYQNDEALLRVRATADAVTKLKHRSF